MNRPSPRPAPITPVAVVFEGSLALVAVAVGWLFNFSPLEKLRMTASDWWLVLLIGAGATIPMFGGLAIIQRISWRPVVRLRDVAGQVLSQLLGRCTTAELAVISLCAGVGEEVLFRGLLQGGIAAWIGAPHGTWIAVTVSSLAFGCAHAITRTYALLAALAGAYMGVLFLWTDNLLVPIVAHAVYDFGAMLYVLRTGDDSSTQIDALD